MAANSRFAVAIHAATVLACNCDSYITSDLIAQSVNTNPVVVRRIVSALTKAGIVETNCGKSGGSRLAKKPSQITLLDIYQAVEKQGLFALSKRKENRECKVSCCMKDILSRVFNAAEQSVEASFGKMTLADMIKPIK
jgi:Rrf2 family protein